MRKILLSIILIGIVATPHSLMAIDQVVNIYSARKEALILPLLKRFKKETGISYRLVTGKADGLLKRLEIEGSLSPADVFITVDAGRLHRAKQAGVLQTIETLFLKIAFLLVFVIVKTTGSVFRSVLGRLFTIKKPWMRLIFLPTKSWLAQHGKVSFALDLPTVFIISLWSLP